MGRTKHAKAKASKDEQQPVEATSSGLRGFLFGKELDEGAQSRLREIAGLASLAFALFLFVALASYRTPHNDPLSASWNWCGQVGWYCAHLVKASAGNAGFLLCFLFAAWGVVMVAGREVRMPGLRIFGSLCFVTSLALLLQHGMGPTVEEASAIVNPYQPFGPGGWVALHTVPYLVEKFGAFGLTLVLVLTLGVSALLATEMGFYGALQGFSEWARQRREERGQSLAAAVVEHVKNVGRGVFGFLAGKPAEPATDGPRLANARVETGETMFETAELAEDSTKTRRRRTKKQDDEVSPDDIDHEWQGTPETLDEDEEEEFEDMGEPIVAALVDEDEADSDDDDDADDDDVEDADVEHAESDDDEDETELVPPAPPAKKPLAGIKKDAPRWDPPTPPPGEWKLPEPSMLIAPSAGGATDGSQLETQARKLETTLKSFGIEGVVHSPLVGPAVTLFEVSVPDGTRLSKVSSLSNEIAAGLRATSIRIQAPIPGRDTVGVEVPNAKRRVVRISELIVGDAYDKSKYALPLFLGQDTEGNAIVHDLAKMPHLLIAGTTGSGKSVCINTILASLLLTRSPHETKLILIDPKAVEMEMYSGLPHLMCPVVSEAPKATAVLNWAVEKMEGRYELLKDANVKNIKSYNALGEAGLRERLKDNFDEERTPRHLPYIVVVIDELADLMAASKKEAEQAIVRLAQKSRAAGIHLIVATQRPSTDVITGVLKGNLPTRIAFQVASKVDSRVILDDGGAASLLGNGDMLFMPPGGARLLRVQGALIEDNEIEQIVNFVCKESAPTFSQELVQVASGIKPVGMVSAAADEDPLFDQAVRTVLKSKRGSASMLQRAMGVGYNRASRLIEMMTEQGILGPHLGSKQRELLITLEEWEEQYGAALGLESDASANKEANNEA